MEFADIASDHLIDRESEHRKSESKRAAGVELAQPRRARRVTPRKGITYMRQQTKRCGRGIQGGKEKVSRRVSVVVVYSPFHLTPLPSLLCSLFLRLFRLLGMAETATGTMV